MKNRLGLPQPVTISWSLARVAATNRSDRSRSSCSALAVGSPSVEGTRSGIDLALTAGQDHHRELQPLDPVHRRQPHARSPIVLLLQHDGRDLRRLEQRLVVVLEQLAGAGHQADVLGLLVLEQFLAAVSTRNSCSSLGRVEVTDLGLRAGQQRLVALLLVLLAVEVVHLARPAAAPSPRPGFARSCGS